MTTSLSDEYKMGWNLAHLNQDLPSISSFDTAKGYTDYLKARPCDRVPFQTEAERKCEQYWERLP